MIKAVNKKHTLRLVGEVAVVWVSSMKRRQVWILIFWSSISYMLSIADITDWCLFKLCLRLSHLGKPAIDFGECSFSVSLSLCPSVCLHFSWIHAHVHTHKHTCLSCFVTESCLHFLSNYKLPRLHFWFLIASVHCNMWVLMFTVTQSSSYLFKVWTYFPGRSKGMSIILSMETFISPCKVRRP